MIKEPYYKRHENASNDYLQAYNIVNGYEVGQSNTVTIENVKAFRKYIYDLSLKQDKEFSTRKRAENSLYITRLS